LAVTRRGVILGFGLLIAICCLAYFNDGVIRQPRLVYNLLPPVIYGGLIAVILIANPVLRRLNTGWAFTRAELALMLTLAAVGGSISSYGFAQTIPTTLMVPHHDVRIRPGWSDAGLIGQILPAYLLADPSGDEDRVLTGYMTGLADGDSHIGLFDVPWGAWGRALAWWLPAVGAVLVMTVGLSIVVHRQWSVHECLPYPIPALADALLPEASGAKNSLWGSQLFWCGALVACSIHFNNYACRWCPQALIPIRLHYDFTALHALVPVLGTSGMRLLRPNVIFAVVGLSYFIATDVSFTMSVAPFLFCALTGVLTTYGVAVRYGNHLTPHPQAMMFAGGYAGLLAMMLYTGRHYYWQAVRRGFFFKSSDEIAPHVAVAVRATAVAAGIFVLMLTGTGVAWPFALFYTCGVAMVYLVISRTVVETGAFWIGSHVFPAVIILGFMGPASFGLRSALILFLVSTVILCAPGWAPMPFIVHALKLGEKSSLPVPKLARTLYPAIVVALFVTAAATIYWQYDQGAPNANWWPRRLAGMPFETIVGVQQRLAAQGVLEHGESLGTLERLAHPRSEGTAVLTFSLAFVVCVGMGLARLRFSWWPLHPLCFVFVDAGHGQMLWFSFFLGWCVKTGVSRYGGARLYQKLKPLMIGLIVGELFAMFIPSVVGTIAYSLGYQVP
jgi:hypothetical protein